ncbi:hypothetical protein [Streptomyces sp. NPDC059979]|uniref:hypothetical protein n=1 Tax=Streptomyces sp. NPDC059979 TaxID=3347021 RepID=UPI0036B99751
MAPLAAKSFREQPTTWKAWSDRTRSTILVPHTAVTSAPSVSAIRTANVLTPPDAR